MTEEHKASRTIVKSPPELWAECSVAQSLARHLGEFGEIRITRLEPETTVAWEGEHASGTVRLEPSGWGTQVTLTATPIISVVPEPAVEPEPEPVAVVEPEPVAVEPEPEVVEPEPEVLVPEPVVPGVEDRGQQPRWPVFARLWARLGRKSHDHEDVADVEGPPEHVPEPVEQVPEPVEQVPEPVEQVPEPVEQAPEPVEQAPEPVPEAPEPATQLDHQALLVGALDSLGQAHHRPFSRA